MPFVETSLPSGKVLKWLKGPGEPFVFGDQLCILVVEDAVFLRKSRSASRLTGTKQRRKWKRHRIETHPIGRIEVEVIAAEPGTMRAHVIGVGDPASVGDVLAVLQTGEDRYVSPPADALADLPPLRVVANHLDAGEG
jgi:hypothetical protein